MLIKGKTGELEELEGDDEDQEKDEEFEEGEFDASPEKEKEGRASLLRLAAHQAHESLANLSKAEAMAEAVTKAQALVSDDDAKVQAQRRRLSVEATKRRPSADATGAGDEEKGEGKKDKKRFIHPDLSAVVILSSRSKLTRHFNDTKVCANAWEMSSFGEAKAFNYVRDHAPLWINHNMWQLSRVSRRDLASIRRMSTRRRSGTPAAKWSLSTSKPSTCPCSSITPNSS